MIDVTQSEIYAVILPRLEEKDREDFKHQLQLAADAKNSLFLQYASSLETAFIWVSTPQGFDYWNDFYERTRIME